MEKRLFFLLDRAHHKLFSELDRSSRQRFGIPLAQLVGLWAIKANEPINMITMGRRMGLKHSAMTGLVRRMQDNGLVTQSRSEQDGRAFEISLTEKGTGLRNEALPLISLVNDQLTEGFSDEEMDAILRFLNRILQGISLPPTEQDPNSAP